MTERKPRKDKRTNRNITKKIASDRLVTVLLCTDFDSERI